MRKTEVGARTGDEYETTMSTVSTILLVAGAAIGLGTGLWELRGQRWPWLVGAAALLIVLAASAITVTAVGGRPMNALGAVVGYLAIVVVLTAAGAGYLRRSGTSL